MFCLFSLHDRKHVNDVNRSKNILSPCGYNLKDWGENWIYLERKRVTWLWDVVFVPMENQYTGQTQYYLAWI